MPDLTLSSAMDAFLAEEDPANVFLPLAGGTMDEDAIITFDNGSRLKEGTTNAGANGGIAQVCSIDYELKWEAGRQYAMQQDGFTIRVEQFGFTTVPTTTDDETKGYVVGSRRILDDGTVYVCTDATEDAAVWAYQGLLDIAGLASINQDTRKLIAPNGIPAAGWDNNGFKFGWDGGSNFYHTLDEYGINTPSGLVIDLGYSYLISAGATSVDWANRKLVASHSLADYAVDWEASVLRHAGIDTVRWGYADLNDLFGYKSLDWNNRQLTGADGTTISVVWENRYLADTTGYSSVDWANRLLMDTSGIQASADWQARQLYDSTGSQSFNWENRQLIASDGTTIAADWSTGTPAFAQGASYTPTAYASLPATPAEGTVCYVNDADSPYSLGSVVTSGGTDKILACFDGTDWRIIAHFP